MVNRTILSFMLLIATANLSQAQWPSAHANAANTGFVNVDTTPASHPLRYANVGRVADGANPVIGANGTVYIGNVIGELFAFQPDGTLLWKRQLPSGFGTFYASPVIGSDGSIYVVSVFTVLNSDGTASVHSYSYLHKFSPGGAWLFWVQFPVENVLLPAWVHGGQTSAPPNIWHFNGAEVIMVPVWYRLFSNWELRLIAFSTTLGVLAVQPVTFVSADITVTWDPPCFYFCKPDPPILHLHWPDPGVAIFEYQGSPFIWVADGVRATVAYKFDLATGFFEVFRFADDHQRTSSPPVALDNVIAAVGTSDGVLKFERAGISIGGFQEIGAAPTRLFDGRLVVVHQSGYSSVMSVVNGSTITLQSQLDSNSFVSAAASCTHVFVATGKALTTFDAKTMLPVARVPWNNGGIHSPVIGPKGHVYGMDRYGLYVFGPPAPTIGGGLLGSACAGHTVVSTGRTL